MDKLSVELDSSNPIDYMAVLADAAENIRPIDIRPSLEYDRQRKAEVDTVKQMASISIDYMNRKLS